MSKPPRGVCKLYGTPQGCKFGKKCKFSHDGGSSGIARGTGSSPSNSRSQTPASPGTRPSASLNGVPRNACQFYWSTGACNRGFECSFRHVKQGSEAGTLAPEQSGAAVVEPGGAAVDFFSPEGLAANVGSAREQRHTFNPGEVHNHLKEFTQDNFRFEGPAQVQGFVRVLGSVNDRNKTWVRSSL